MSPLNLPMLILVKGNMSYPRFVSHGYTSLSIIGKRITMTTALKKDNQAAGKLSKL
jgi:hypothetical protein